MSESLSSFDQVEQALTDPTFSTRYPGVANYASHGGLIDVMRDLQERLLRLEMTNSLWMAPVRDCILRKEPFKKWLDKNWATGSASYLYRHQGSGVTISISVQPYEEDGRLREVLLAMSAAEGRTPRDLLLEIDPDAFPSAIDALGATVRTD